MLRRALASALLLALATGAAADSFTYRGRLTDDGQPAHGRYDLQFQLFADAAGTQPLGGPRELQEVTVSDGAFAAALELPATPTGVAWLSVAVRPVGEFAWWPLGDRQAVSLKADACPAAWSLTGNAGTFPNINFLGTTDNQPLQLGANNRVAAIFRVETSDPANNRAVVQLGAPTNFIASRAFNTTIGGGGNNTVHDAGATVAGGEVNTAGSTAGDAFVGTWATVGGGFSNAAQGTSSTISGGGQNRASGANSTIGGGGLNEADGLNATIAGGSSNTARAERSSIGGGGNNYTFGQSATVPGGTSNSANGSNSVAAGDGSCAGGNGSFALGNRAQVRTGSSTDGGPICSADTGTSLGDNGTFVWADSQELDFVSSGEDQFLLRARGGVSINAAPIADAVELSIIADADDSDFANLFLRQRSNNAGILFSSGGASATGDNNAAFFIDHFNGAGGQARRLALNSDGSVLIRSNITASNTGVTMAAGSGSWSALSDRHVKTAIVAIDPAAVLDRLLAVPISEWSYIAQGEGIRHLGPMAQDFAAAFGLGENATTISSIDADGVALAAIQGLNAKLESENAALRGELAALRRMVEALQGEGSR